MVLPGQAFLARGPGLYLSALESGRGGVVALFLSIAAGAALWAVRGWSRAPLAIFIYFIAMLFPVLGFMNACASLFICRGLGGPTRPLPTIKRRSNFTPTRRPPTKSAGDESRAREIELNLQRMNQANR